ncbi:MAG: gluconeogenesis factor YvcK family protein, partial [Bacillota bacterium]
MELKVVALGGGTGLSTLLRGLKQLTSKITAIVTVSDDGGSSGRLRAEMGVLPPGDIRNCLVALADSESLMTELFNYRFKGNGPLAGHSFGNLFIAAMSDITGDFDLAVKRSSDVLAIRGRVLPATCDDCVLGAILEDGRRVLGERVLATCDSPISRVFLEPGDCKPLPEALRAIDEADAIVLGPGSLYTSVIPNLLVPGMADAIATSKAVKIYVCNVMTEAGETTGYTAQRHLAAIRNHAGDEVVDWVIVSNSPISRHLREKYLAEGAEPVRYDADELRAMGVGVV